jgi:hypothetical protein
MKECLQGRVKFPIGGKVRERKLNRCDSGTDSTVWMEEGDSANITGMILAAFNT